MYAIYSNINRRVTIRILILVVISGVLSLSCHSMQIKSENAQEAITEPTINVIMVSDVKWEQLNPARGSNSPMAATLWGDRTGPGASGFLLKPIDGFRSPPHIHSSGYHGVVIKGAIHNARPDVEDRYLTPVSFWTQPGGAVHVTASKGNSLAYIEVEGEFDVLPEEKGAPNNTSEIIIPASSISWSELHGMSTSTNGVKIAVLWQDPLDEMRGTLVKLSSGFVGTMPSNDETFYAVVIQGTLMHQVQGKSDPKTLEPGSYYGSNGNALHEITCLKEGDCVIYIRSDHRIEIENSM